MEKSVENGAERRVSDRVQPTDTTTVWLTADGVPYQCVIEDISSSGVRLKAQDEIPHMAKLQIEHDIAGQLDAECKWQANGILGLQFHQPISNLEQVLRVVCVLLHPDDLARSSSSRAAY